MTTFPFDAVGVKAPPPSPLADRVREVCRSLQVGEHTAPTGNAMAGRVQKPATLKKGLADAKYD